MIKLIQHHYQDFFKEEMSSLYKRRYKVFKEKLGWEIPSKGIYDIDQFDIKETIYLICTDDKNEVCGGIRFLPTTGTYMLKDTFPYLVDKSFKFPNHPLMWESSRFFYDKARGKDERIGISRQGTVELIIAIMEFILTFSPYGLVTVTDTRTEKICLQIGLPCRRISLPQKMGNLEAICLHVEADVKSLEAIKKKHNITGPLVWAPLPLKIPFIFQSLVSKPFDQNFLPQSKL